MEKKRLFVPFVTQCAWCGTTLSVEFQYMALGEREIDMFEKYGKVISHGACEICAKKELKRAMEEVKHA